jgi:ArsR family metal-binding transcriptional regulator
MGDKFLTKDEASKIVSIYMTGLVLLKGNTKNDKEAVEADVKLAPKLIFALLKHTKIENEQEKRNTE